MTTTTPRSQIPKRIDPARGCFFQLPGDIPEAELTRYEVAYRAEYGGIFRIRVGNRFFFELGSTRNRERFLLGLEAANLEIGVLTRRDVIY